jgi:hypothetical protein
MPIKKPAEKTTNRGRHRSRGEVVLYKPPDGGAALQVRIDKETVWLTQRQMAELFGKDTDTVGLHIRNVYKEGELEETATTEDSSVVQREGGRTVRRTVRRYNLDVIISVDKERLRDLSQNLHPVCKVSASEESGRDSVSAFLAHTAGDGKGREVAEALKALRGTRKV